MYVIRHLHSDPQTLQWVDVTGPVFYRQMMGVRLTLSKLHATLTASFYEAISGLLCTKSRVIASFFSYPHVYCRAICILSYTISTLS